MGEVMSGERMRHEGRRVEDVRRICSSILIHDDGDGGGRGKVLVQEVGGKVEEQHEEAAAGCRTVLPLREQMEN